jgi:hypothetical protein
MTSFIAAGIASSDAAITMMNRRRRMVGLQHNDLKITRRVGGNKIEIVGEWEQRCELFALRAYLNGELVSTTSSDNLTDDAIALLDDVATEIEPPDDETPEEGTP